MKTPTTLHALRQRIATLPIALLLLTLTALPSTAQFYVNGGEPSTLPRKEIKLKPFRIIYHKEADSLGYAVADRINCYLPATLFQPLSQKPFPIILRSQTPYSNGMVAWTPSRMILYPLTAGEAAEPVPWLDHLTAHELRHYAQMRALNRRIFYGLFPLIGEINVALASALTPRWFLEGDAMYNESRRTPYGRAHSALTYQQYRVDLLTDNTLKYDQYINRSLRYWAPSHYEFGSMMVEYGSWAYGPEFWPNTLDHVSKCPYSLFPFHYGIKRQSAISRHQLFEHAMLTADSLFMANSLTPSDRLPQKRGKYAMERFPYHQEGTTYYYHLSWDLNHIAALCRIDSATKKQKRIAFPRNVMGKIRYQKGYATWAERTYSPIWPELQHADMVILNLNSGKKRRITKGINIISPILDLNDSSAVAITVNGRGQYHLVRIGLATGQPSDTARLSTPGELRELAPGRTPHETLLRLVTTEGVSIYSYNWSTGQQRRLLGPIYADISGLGTSPKGVYFTASYANMRRAFFLPWSDDDQPTQPLVVHLPAYGVEDITPLADGDILFSAFGVNGYQTARATPHPEPDPVDLGSPRTLFASSPEPTPPAPQMLSRDSLTSRRYSPLRHAVRVHSWLPYWLPQIRGLEFTGGNIFGIQLYSQNAIETLTITAGYQHSITDIGTISLNYTGIWPHISLEGEIGRNSRNITSPGQIAIRGVGVSGSMGLSFPLTWRLGAYTLHIAPRLTLAANNDLLAPSLRHAGSSYRLNGTAAAGISLMRRKAPRDLYPRWGVLVGGNIRVPLAYNHLFSDIYEVYSTLYLPGIVPSHSLRLWGRYVDQNPRTYYSLLSFPNFAIERNLRATELRGLSYLDANIAYSLPLGYPDWNWGSWVYFKRFWTTLFATYSQTTNLALQPVHYRTIGAELNADLHLFRTQYLVQVGLRVAYSPFGDKIGDLITGPLSIQANVNLGLDGLSMRP